MIKHGDGNPSVIGRDAESRQCCVNCRQIEIAHTNALYRSWQRGQLVVGQQLHVHLARHPVEVVVERRSSARGRIYR